MLIYSCIMFLLAVLFAVLGIAIFRGKTDLIHEYHQRKVADKFAYGKAFGKAIFVIVAVFVISGAVGLFESLALHAVLLLALGLSIGIGIIFAVQRKYNNGIF